MRPPGFNPAMPESLATAADELDDVTKQAVIDSWRRLGASGRTAYRSYLEAPRFRRIRRKRAELAIVQLIAPDQPLRIPGGGLGTGKPN